ncbi:MAG: hypothetical protein IPF54_02440 [Draconibacterium sp.]|nr:hypothetical protein [Draconibacterium sp.]
MKRRSFIQKSSIATAGLITAFNIPAFAQNQKLKIGLIGAGWYGMVITEAALKVGGVEVIAICDIDTEHLKPALTNLNRYREAVQKNLKITMIYLI